ncbi:MAG: hypothetical protein IJX99_09055 [Clostridia bacterium]|nr:hypothetical protein [Clostridia bacterium]
MENKTYKERAEHALKELLLSESDFKPVNEMQTYAMELKAFLEVGNLNERMMFLKDAVNGIYSKKARSGQAWLNHVVDITFDLFEENFSKIK